MPGGSVGGFFFALCECAAGLSGTGRVGIVMRRRGLQTVLAAAAVACAVAGGGGAGATAAATTECAAVFGCRLFVAWGGSVPTSAVGVAASKVFGAGFCVEAVVGCFMPAGGRVSGRLCGGRCGGVGGRWCAV